MKTLQQQARELLARSDYLTSRYFLRRYYTEQHLRINTTSGMEISIDSLKQLASDSEYSKNDALDWIWSPDDDEFLLGEHVSDLVRSEIKNLGIKGLEFNVESAGTNDGLRMWRINISVSELDGGVVVFDVRGVKNLLKQIHNAFLSEA